MTTTTGPKFALGQTFATPGAMDALAAAGERGSTYFARHVTGDWGEVDAHDKRVNDQAVKHGGRIVSAYRLSTGAKIWLITEAGRHATTLLLPDEY